MILNNQGEVANFVVVNGKLRHQPSGKEVEINCPDGDQDKAINEALTALKALI